MKTSSSIITDFGYQGDGHGRDYYFGKMVPANMRSPYSDIPWDPTKEPRVLTTLEYQNEISEFVVPKAPAPVVRATASIDSLAKYVAGELPLASNGNTRLTKVIEKDSIFIGAPSKARILSAFEMSDSGSKMKYLKENDGSKNLSGISFTANVFRNTSVVQCEGDLAINGTLHLKNLQLESATGCRIYVTGSVFIYGPIRYLKQTAKTNLQISSARSVLMGLGDLKNTAGTYCEPNAWYTVAWAPDLRTSSLRYRLDPDYGMSGEMAGFFFRDPRAPQDIMREIYNEALQIQPTVGVPQDASCRPEGRDLGFDRLLLNAPQVHSRYRGNFSGVIIAEFALMSLGQFVYTFDNVFAEVPVLPKLKTTDYLDVQ